MDLERGEASQLTTDGGHSAVWSPDATQIAYAGVFEPALSTDLRVIDLDSGATRRLTSDEWEIVSAICDLADSGVRDTV